MNWFKAKVVQHIVGSTSIGWCITDYNQHVLHCDGVVRNSLVNEDGAFTGLFAKREQAEAAYNKYKVPFTVKDLKAGDTFKLIMDDKDIPGSVTQDEVCTVYDGWILPFADCILLCLIYTRKSEPYNLKWLNKDCMDMEVTILSRVGE